MDWLLYNLSRIYGMYGMKAQKYSLINPRGLPGRMRAQWHAYRILLIFILFCALMLFMQNMVIFWSAFAAGIAALYAKGALEEKLDDGLLELRRKELEDESKSESPPV